MTHDLFSHSTICRHFDCFQTQKELQLIIVRDEGLERQLVLLLKREKVVSGKLEHRFWSWGHLTNQLLWVLLDT